MIIYGVLFAVIPIAIIAAIFIPAFNPNTQNFNPDIEERKRINKQILMCEESNSGDTVVIDGKEYEC